MVHIQSRLAFSKPKATTQVQLVRENPEYVSQLEKQFGCDKPKIAMPIFFQVAGVDSFGRSLSELKARVPITLHPGRKELSKTKGSTRVLSAGGTLQHVALSTYSMYIGPIL